MIACCVLHKQKKILVRNTSHFTSGGYYCRLTIFLNAQPRLLRRRDRVPGWQDRTHSPIKRVLYTGFLIDRGSDIALSYCLWVPQLCASSMKPFSRLGCSTASSKLNWSYCSLTIGLCLMELQLFKLLPNLVKVESSDHSEKHIFIKGTS